MKLSQKLSNPITGVLSCFSSSWQNLSTRILDKLRSILSNCGYSVGSNNELFKVMDVLCDMGLIAITYSGNKPEKVRRLC